MYNIIYVIGFFYKRLVAAVAAVDRLQYNAWYVDQKIYDRRTYNKHRCTALCSNPDSDRVWEKIAVSRS